MIAASNSWCLAYDNLSHVRSWLSDAMCRLSTGGGFTTRALYTNQEEVIFDSQRPVLLTSIEDIATRSDLLDRCLIVSLPTIDENHRRPEAEMMAEFEAARSRILGALLDGVSASLRNLPSVKLPRLPRLADFAIKVTAAEAGLGWKPGSFLDAYQGNRASANELALESSPISRPLLDLLEECQTWCGTSSELLQQLEAKGAEQLRRLANWPKNPRALSGQLNRLAPNLRAAGWSITNDRTSKRKAWTFCLMTQTKVSDAVGHHNCVTTSACDVAQVDAGQCELSGNDADDADDANSGANTADSNREDEVPF